MYVISKCCTTTTIIPTTVIKNKKMQFFCPFPLMPASSATTALTIKMQEGEIENKESL